MPDDLGTHPPAVSAPPTTPGALGRPETRPSWPTVLGVIALILGLGGFVFGLWGVIGHLIMGAYQPPEMAEALARWTLWSVGLAVLNMILAAALLIAGIGLIKRRVFAARLIVRWAVARIVVGFVASIIAGVIQAATLEAMQNEGTALPAQFSTIMLVTTVVLGTLWAWALPVFVLIWFKRKTIQSHIASWR